MRPFPVKPLKLEDCRDHGPGSKSELFLVEGDSAAGAVTVMRNAGFQATLPMQGKPLNALKATHAKVLSNELYQRLSESLRVPMRDFEAKQGQHTLNFEGQSSPNDGYLKELRFERILMLFDPDADGIHIGALMLMFFYRWMRPLLASGRIEMVRAPLFAINWKEADSALPCKSFAYSMAQSQSILQTLRKQGAVSLEIRHFRGLGSIDQPLLNDTCVDPGTRRTQIMSVEDAQSAISVFGSQVKLGL
jgi:DNA gyrase subunit B